MIYEERIYDIPPAAKEEHTEYLQTRAIPTVVKYGGKLIGMWETLVGELNQVVVLMGWDSLDKRMATWDEAQKDEEYTPQWCSIGAHGCVS